MNNLILMALKNKLDDISNYGEVDVETQRNTLKEELQFYVLNFIYHHRDFSDWTMYGGSALRICHGLDRMSVDLDFEVKNVVTDEFLGLLKEEVEKYFNDTYNVGSEMLVVKITSGRGLILRFIVGDELGINHPSKQVHVKIDLNHFVAPKTVIERRPINHGQLSFVIKTYNMSSLMASKIAAIFLRGQRGVGEAIYEEKGRDIYDLLWYMTKKIVPDLDYLIAKGIDVKDLRVLFDKLTLKMNAVNNINLKQDLSPLFLDQTFINNWLDNWLENYLHLLNDYKINTVTGLQKIIINEDFQTDNFSFVYLYHTTEGSVVNVEYIVVYEWIESEKILGMTVNEDLIKLVEFKTQENLSIQLKQFITLFYEKTENYLKKTNHVILGNKIKTKIIRTTTNNLNQKEQIVLNKSVLLSCGLDDLLK